jgi:hypothetical protein
MLDQFTYGEYRQLLTLIKAGRTNLCFSDFGKSDTPASFFILRHDVDFSLDAAVSMARIEAEMGLRATYFLLLTADTYNLLSENNCAVPRQLMELGHEVGLHYDVRAMAAMAERCASDLRTQLLYEVEILSRMTGCPIQSIAMHNPSVYGDDPFAGDNLYVNAYDPRFTKVATYFSDSCGAWRNDAHRAFGNSDIPDRLQLLIHPIFWAERPGDRWKRLRDWGTTIDSSLKDRQVQIRNGWLNHSGVREHDARSSLT